MSFTIDRSEFIRKIGCIGHKMYRGHELTVVEAGRYVALCTEEFSLTEDEQRRMIRIVVSGDIGPNNKMH